MSRKKKTEDQTQLAPALAQAPQEPAATETTEPVQEPAPSCLNCKSHADWPEGMNTYEGEIFTICPDCQEPNVFCPEKCGYCGSANMPTAPVACSSCFFMTFDSASPDNWKAQEENGCGNCLHSAAWSGPEEDDAPVVCHDCFHLLAEDGTDNHVPFDAPFLEDGPPAFVLPEGSSKIGEDKITAPLTLSEEERQACGKRMADALCEKSRLEDELDMFRKGINGRIKEQEVEAITAARLWRSGKEEREVECYVIADYNAGKVVFVERNYPYRKVFSRPMTEKERQLPLPLEADTQARVDALAEEGEQDVPFPDLHQGNESGDTPTCSTCAHVAGDDDECSSCKMDTLGNYAPRQEQGAATVTQ